MSGPYIPDLIVWRLRVAAEQYAERAAVERQANASPGTRLATDHHTLLAAGVERLYRLAVLLNADVGFASFVQIQLDEHAAGLRRLLADDLASARLAAEEALSVAEDQAAEAPWHAHVMAVAMSGGRAQAAEVAASQEPEAVVHAAEYTAVGRYLAYAVCLRDAEGRRSIDWAEVTCPDCNRAAITLAGADVSAVHLLTADLRVPSPSACGATTGAGSFQRRFTTCPDCLAADADAGQGPEPVHLAVTRSYDLAACGLRTGHSTIQRPAVTCPDCLAASDAAHDTDSTEGENL